MYTSTINGADFISERGELKPLRGLYFKKWYGRTRRVGDFWIPGERFSFISVLFQVPFPFIYLLIILRNEIFWRGER